MEWLAFFVIVFFISSAQCNTAASAAQCNPQCTAASATMTHPAVTTALPAVLR
jgi:hypothetical protein